MKSPSFIKMELAAEYTDGSGNNVVDPSMGTTDKGDNWHVIIATETIETAQQISALSTNIDIRCAIQQFWHAQRR